MPLLRVFGETRADTLTHVIAAGSGACVGDRLRVCLGTTIGTADIVVMDPQGMYFTVVSELRATGAERRTFAVTRRSLRGDVLMRTAIPYVPEVVPRSYADSLSDYWMEALMNPPGSRPRFTRQEAIAAVRDGLQIPAYFPPVYAVATTVSGDTWLQAHTTSRRPMWLVLNTTGRPTATVTGAPTGFQLKHVTDEMVWGVVTDQMDVPYLLALRIVKP